MSSVNGSVVQDAISVTTLMGPTIAGAVAIVIWSATRIFDYFSKRTQRAEEKEHFIKALFAEIDFNTTDMREFLDSEHKKYDVFKRIRLDSKYAPHITDARHTQIYRSKVDFLFHIDDNVLPKIVVFYGLCERIKVQIEGIYRPTYSLISENGRINVINQIFNRCKECAEVGESIMGDMACAYDGYKLKRYARKASDNSEASLTERHEALTSNLNRIRTNHDKIS